MADIPFETIPAWRIARLRAALRDAERRGATADEAAQEELAHRAFRRRFEMGLARKSSEAAPAGPRPLRTTRKGRRFSSRKLSLIWHAILHHRPPTWRQGDKAPFGAIARAHAEASASCRAAGIAVPRYRTVAVLWHRGVVPPEVVAALARGE